MGADGLLRTSFPIGKIRAIESANTVKCLVYHFNQNVTIASRIREVVKVRSSGAIIEPERGKIAHERRKWVESGLVSMTKIESAQPV
jgi:hypothetical protein